jgi:hypothetical protein
MPTATKAAKVALGFKNTSKLDYNLMRSIGDVSPDLLAKCLDYQLTKG